MLTRYAGYFAVPESSLDELTRLREQWLRSLHARDGEFLVQRNKIYRHAADVCVTHRYIVGRYAPEALLAIEEFLNKAFQFEREQDIFCPDEVHTMARGIDAMERRVGGEEAVVKQVHRSIDNRPIEVVRELYQAFKQVLAEADERGLGLIRTVLREGAEEQLAEEREQRRRNQLDWDNLTPEEHARLMAQFERNKAKLQALIDASEEESLRAELNQNPNKPSGAPVHYVLVPRDHAARLRRRLVRAHVRHERDLDYDRYSPIETSVRDEAKKQAREIITLTRRGERLGQACMTWCLIDRDRSAVQATGSYTPAQARKLLAVLDAWRDEVGEHALINEFLDSYEARNTYRLVRNAYRTFRRALAEASEHDCGLFVW